MLAFYLILSYASMSLYGLYSVGGAHALAPMCVFCIPRQIKLMHTSRGSPLTLCGPSFFLRCKSLCMFCHRPPKRGRLKEHFSFICFVWSMTKPFGLMCVVESQAIFYILYTQHLSWHRRNRFGGKEEKEMINWSQLCSWRYYRWAQR